MSSIKTSLELADKVTKPLQIINQQLSRTTSGFTTAGSAADRLGRSSASAMRNVSSISGRLASQVATVGNAFQSVQRSSNGFMRAMLGVSVIEKVFGAVVGKFDSAIKRMDTMTNYARTMTAITGSSSLAQKSLDDLNQAVRGTAYGLDVGAKAVQNFTTRGMDITSATNEVKKWADAVSFYGDGTNATLSTVTDALGKMLSKGKVDMEQMNRLTDSGINAVGMYAKAVGRDVASVQDDLSHGRITAQEFITTTSNAFENGTNGVLKIAGAAKKAGTTWAATIDNAGAAVTRGLATMVENINRTLSYSGLPTIQKMITNIGGTLEKMLGGIGKVFGQIIAWIGKNKEEILGWVKTIFSVAVAWSVVSSAVSGVIAVVNILSSVIGVLGGAFSAVLGVGVIAAIAGIASGISGLIDWFTNLNEKTGDIGKTIEIVFANVKIVVEKVKKWFTVAIDTITIAWSTMCLGMSTMINGVASVVLNMVGIIQSAFDWLHNEISIWDDFADKMSPELQQKLGINGDTFRWKGGEQTLADADALARQIETDAMSTAKKIEELEKEIKNSDSGVTRARANAKALEDRYTRNLGNDRGNKKKSEDGKKKKDAITTNISNNTAKTAANTNKISKQLAMNGETLKYIKDYAVQKTINRYTSSDIKISMPITNNMNGKGMNIDGVVKKLKSTLERELTSTAEGVHA